MLEILYPIPDNGILSRNQVDLKITLDELEDMKEEIDFDSFIVTEDFIKSLPYSSKKVKRALIRLLNFNLFYSNERD